MGRGRSSTNYTNAEKQLLLRAVAAVKPRKASCWHAIADHYNAHRGELVERDAHSLKRKFKALAAAPRPRDGELENPFATRAQQLMQQMKSRAIAIANGQYAPQDDIDDDEAAASENGESERTGPTRASPAVAVAAPASAPPSARDEQRRLPSLVPLLPGPTSDASQPPVNTTPMANGAPTGNVASTPPVGGGGPLTSDLAQLLLVIREENAQRELTRRAEWEQALAREERFRHEARELRRQERNEATAREERFWREMAEQRRRDREETAARHEQMMVLLSALIKPATAPAANAPTSATATRSSRHREA
jgi:hypothetical protein